MKDYSLLLMVFSLVLFSSFTSADIIVAPDTTHKTIDIVSNITNIKDFPEYIFVSYSIGGPCSFAKIESDGIIHSAGGYGNYCKTVEVYAIKETDFNLIIDTSSNSYNYTFLKDFFNSSKVIKVIGKIPVESISVPVTDTRNRVYNEYTVNLSSIQKNSTKTIVEKDYSFYYFLTIPAIALIVVIFVISKRKSTQENK